MTKRTKDITKEDWRQLGFYYDRDDASRTWIFAGSPYGLGNLSKILQDYSDDKRRHDAPSEHEHYGPYMYLKLMTWHECGIFEDSIAGRLEDFRRLKRLVERESRAVNIGKSIQIGEEYSPGADYGIELRIQAYGSDPAVLDEQLWIDTET